MVLIGDTVLVPVKIVCQKTKKKLTQATNLLGHEHENASTRFAIFNKPVDIIVVSVCGLVIVAVALAVSNRVVVVVVVVVVAGAVVVIVVAIARCLEQTRQQ